MLTGIQTRARREYRYLFGPVPSRRLGRSLGVDLTPFKTCSLDCVFCQLGRTTRRTIERREYVPTAVVEAEMENWIGEGARADYITLSGSGEPTLHTRFGDVLQFIRARTDIPTALLSNGTLFWLPDVREAAGHAALVKLSLSAWDQSSFQRVNRPHPGIDFERVIEGQRAFRHAFHGRLWIEVFLIEGVNSRPEDVKKIARIVESLAPDEIHLNTAVRPPAEQSVLPLDHGGMEVLAATFRPPGKVIAGFPAHNGAGVAAGQTAILDLLRRRPCTTLEIGKAFGMHVNEVSKHTGELVRTHRIQPEWRGGEVYFRAAPKSNRDREDRASPTE